MYWNEIKRIASAIGFIVGLITLCINLLRGHTLLHSSYTAIITLIITSILVLLSLRGIGNILSNYLLEKKIEAEKHRNQRAKELAKEKLEELKKKREMYEQRQRERLAQHAENIEQENNMSDETLSA